MDNIIAVDFDGTLCEHRFPGIGPENKLLFTILKKLRAKGAKLILWTCREGERLQEAVDFCKGLGLEFDAINENACETYDEFAISKVLATEYIDDRGCTPGDFIMKHDELWDGFGDK